MTDPHWQAAWQWVMQRRRHAPHNADIWHLRHHAGQILPELWQQVQDRTFRLSPAQVVRGTRPGRAEDRVLVWSAADALVLKWVALTTGPGLDIHPACLHLQGGAHRAVRQVAEHLSTGRWQWVYRTDIRGYYRHIRKDAAWRVWQTVTDDPACLSLIHQYLHYSTEDGGEIHTPVHGIPRACALSPLTGALVLRDMDRHFSAQPAWRYDALRG